MLTDPETPPVARLSRSALVLALGLALAALPLAAEPEARQGIDRLAWLAGCWASVEGGEGTMEPVDFYFKPVPCAVER